MATKESKACERTIIQSVVMPYKIVPRKSKGSNLSLTVYSHPLQDGTGKSLKEVHDLLLMVCSHPLEDGTEKG